MATTQLTQSAARCTTNPTLSGARTALVHALLRRARAARTNSEDADVVHQRPRRAGAHRVRDGRFRDGRKEAHALRARSRSERLARGRLAAARSRVRVCLDYARVCVRI